MAITPARAYERRIRRSAAAYGAHIAAGLEHYGTPGHPVDGQCGAKTCSVRHRYKTAAEINAVMRFLISLSWDTLNGQNPLSLSYAQGWALLDISKKLGRQWAKVASAS